MEMQVESLLKDLTSAIQNVFGFNPYPWQLEVFLKVLIGLQDIIVSAGTAEGKSLCYQGMALLHPEATVLVISPIKSLMDDQVCESLSNKVADRRCIPLQSLDCLASL